jgi:hypothetical protein
MAEAGQSGSFRIAAEIDLEHDIAQFIEGTSGRSHGTVFSLEFALRR